jgi:stage II sporulation protein D
MVRALIFLICIFIYSGSPLASDIRVSIYNEHSLSAIIISPDNGKYIVRADGKELFIIEENDLLYISRKGDRLFVSSKSGSPGIFENVSVVSSGQDGGFSIKPVHSSLQKSFYHGNLQLSVNYERISIINEVDKIHYLAGVVEAEAGTGAASMYYKAQSVICRTYLYGNLHRHADEGFDLCDEVHCQVYKGRMTDNRAILDAVIATAGKVIVCNEGRLITAAFHANCGGQTVSSEEVWLLPRSYLRPVTDPWCHGRPGSTWQVTINAAKWRSYMEDMGLKDTGDRRGPAAFRSNQKGRSIFYRVGDFSIPYRKIRADWNLRSAYFDIDTTANGEQILIRGRGYGHGAGLCQEGAMQMALNGYNFTEILQFYYTDIAITDIDKLF